MENWFIPAEVDDAGLPPLEFRLLCTLARRRGSNGEAWPSVTTMANTCGMSRSSVIRHLAALAKRGAVVREHRRGRSDIFKLSPVATWANRCHTGSSVTPEPVSESNHTGCSVTPDRFLCDTPPVSLGHPKVPIEGTQGRNKRKNPANGACFDPAQLALPFQSDEFKQQWGLWCSHRTEIKKRLTPTCARGQLSDLAAMGESRAIQALKHTIAGGWTGIFEPNGRGGAEKVGRTTKSMI
ncbi:MAG: helix-turn-helix domain-containing protein [Verrucomicrobiales bacterium]